MGIPGLDLVGQRFGKLVIVSKTTPNKIRQIRWVCKCDCGNNHITTTTMLRAGNIKSCGCYRNECRKLPGDGGSFNEWFNAYRYNSNYHSRKKEFSLSKREFRLITSKNCQYCGSEPKPYYAKHRAVISPVPYLCNGIDRVNNDIGYTLSNCVPCCSMCNYMKRGLSSSEFINHVHRISSYPEV